MSDEESKEDELSEGGGAKSVERAEKERKATKSTHSELVAVTFP